MNALLQRLFRVLPEERSKLLCFIALAALLQAGLAIGISSADALFLANLGAESLPHVYLFMPVVTLAYAPIYAVLLARLGIVRLFYLTLGLLALGGIAFGVAFHGTDSPPVWLLYGVKFYTGLWFIALYTLFWNFTDDYFGILDGKRLYGLIAAGSAAGGMIGAGLVSGLARVLEPAALFYAWSAFALLTIPIFAATRRHPRLDTGFSGVEESETTFGLLRTIGRAFRSSRFAFSLAAVCFSLVCLSALLEYLSYGIFAEGRDASELAALLGRLYAIAAAITLVINLFFFGRVVGRIGVNNTALLVPLAYLGAFIFFYLQHGILAALVAFYVCQSLLVSIEYNNINLLFNALPGGVRKQLRTFIEALAEPLATACAGLFLLFFASRLGPPGISFIGLLGGAAAVIVALFIRHDYVRALATNLRRDWLDLSPEGFQRVASVTSDDRAHLRHRALHGNRSDRLLATELLWRLGDAHAREALLRYLENSTPDEADRLRPIIVGLLAEPDTGTLAEILLWLEHSSDTCPPELLGEFISAGAIPVRRLEKWRASEAPSDLALAAVARWHNPRLNETNEALEDIRRLLAVGGVSRHWALRAIGDFRHPPHAGELLPWLEDRDATTRLEALRALGKLAFGLPKLPPAVIARLPKANRQELRLLLDIISRSGDTTAVIPILRGSVLFPATESRNVENAIAGMGAKATPGVVHILRDASLPHHPRVIAARILERIAPPQLIALAPTLIDNELDGAPIARSSARLDFILELLSLSGLLPDLDLIRTGLGRANARDRANAIETLQQNIPRPTYLRLLPLIQPSAVAAQP